MTSLFIQRIYRADSFIRTGTLLRIDIWMDIYTGVIYITIIPLWAFYNHYILLFVLYNIYTKIANWSSKEAGTVSQSPIRLQDATIYRDKLLELPDESRVLVN